MYDENQLLESRKAEHLARLQALMQHITEKSTIYEVNNQTVFSHNIQQVQLKKITEDLPQLAPFFIDYGAAMTLAFPFVVDYRNKNIPTTGTTILDALHIKTFRSEHIIKLASATIPFSGYHPLSLNDEIHNDFSQQYLFEHENEGIDLSPNDGLHGELKRKVFDQNCGIWYSMIGKLQQIKKLKFTIEILIMENMSILIRMTGIVVFMEINPEVFSLKKQTMCYFLPLVYLRTSNT